jgi:hypothetical protein
VIAPALLLLLRLLLLRLLLLELPDVALLLGEAVPEGLGMGFVDVAMR